MLHHRKSKKNRGHARSHWRRGNAVVEFAIMAPVYFLIILGTIETCTMIFLQQSLEIAAYEGARVALVPNTQVWNVQSAVDSILVPRKVNGYSVSVTPSSYQSSSYGTLIQVNVSAPCGSNSISPSAFFGSKTLTGSCTMMKEY